MRQTNRKQNMLKTNQLIESLYLKNKGLLTEETKDSVLTYDTLPECVKTNFKRNITISVAFIKKDGTVRHMAFRRNLSAYERSEAEKTEKQLNYLVNNNLMNVYDTNSFIKRKKANKDSGMSEEDAAKAAANESFRNIKLENVMGFLCNGEFYDMRQQNKIAERFGEEIASQLTKAMVNSMKADESMINEELDQPKVIGQEGKQKTIGAMMKKRDLLIAQRAEINKEIEMLNKEIKKWEKEISPNQLTMF
jgi:hypothetical protein